MRENFDSTTNPCVSFVDVLSDLFEMIALLFSNEDESTSEADFAECSLMGLFHVPLQSLDVRKLVAITAGPPTLHVSQGH